MKKAKIAGICLIVLILAAFVSVPVYNNYCAYNVEKMLCETPLPEQTELIEAISQARKLTITTQTYLQSRIWKTHLTYKKN